MTHMLSDQVEKQPLSEDRLYSINETFHSKKSALMAKFISGGHSTGGMTNKLTTKYPY